MSEKNSASSSIHDVTKTEPTSSSSSILDKAISVIVNNVRHEIQLSCKVRKLFNDVLGLSLGCAERDAILIEVEAASEDYKALFHETSLSVRMLDDAISESLSYLEAIDSVETPAEVKRVVESLMISSMKSRIAGIENQALQYIPRHERILDKLSGIIKRCENKKQIASITAKSSNGKSGLLTFTGLGYVAQAGAAAAGIIGSSVAAPLLLAGGAMMLASSYESHSKAQVALSGEYSTMASSLKAVKQCIHTQVAELGLIRGELKAYEKNMRTAAAAAKVPHLFKMTSGCCRRALANLTRAKKSCALYLNPA